MSAERLALVKRYADAMWRDLPDFKLAPAWALYPWIEGPSDVAEGVQHDRIVAR